MPNRSQTFGQKVHVFRALQRSQDFGQKVHSSWAYLVTKVNYGHFYVFFADHT